MEAFIREEMFPEPDQITSLMQKMIYNGKILYFMDATMPDVPDSLKIGYTSQQQKWAEGHAMTFHSHAFYQQIFPYKI